MKKIAVHLLLSPSVGGSYQYWYSVLKALSDYNGKEYLVFGLYYDDDWSGILDGFNIKGIRLNKEKRNKIIYSIIERALWKWDLDVFHYWLTYLSIRKSDYVLLKRESFDLIFSDSIDLAYVLNARGAIPIHDLMHRYEKNIPEMIEGFDYRERMYKRMIKHVSLILTDSELGKKHVIESYGYLRENLEECVEVLPFIAPSYIYDIAEDDSIASLLPQKYIFYPAQFWSHKNHERLLDALAIIKKGGIEVKLVLVGAKDKNYEVVKKKIKDLGLDDQVFALGYVSNDEMIYIYKHARAMIYPTLFGPTNIPPLEAFYLGCPVGASGIYAMPDQLGEAALLFDPLNVQEIADAIIELWTNDALCMDLINKGKSKAQKWGPVQFSERLKSIIDKHICVRDKYEDI